MKYFLLSVLPVFSLVFLSSSLSSAAELKSFDYFGNTNSRLFSKITIDYGPKKSGSPALSGEVVIWDDDGLASLAFLLKIHQQVQLSEANQERSAPAFESEATYHALTKTSRFLSAYFLERSKFYIPPQQRGSIFSWRGIKKLFGYYSNPYLQTATQLDQLTQNLENKDPKNLTKGDLEDFENSISERRKRHFYNVNGAPKHHFHLDELQLNQNDWTGCFSKILRDFSQQILSKSKQNSILVDITLPMDPKDLASPKKEPPYKDLASTNKEPPYSRIQFQFSALSLAIHHFNSDHSNPLEAGGREHTFMKSVLTAISNELPLLHHFETKTTENENPKEFKFITTLFGDSPEDPSDFPYSKVLNAVNQVTQGCPHREESSENYGTLNRFVSYNLTQTECENKRALEMFQFLGLQTLTIQEVQYLSPEKKVKSTFATLRLLPKELKLRDTKYFHEALRRSPHTRAFAEALDHGEKLGLMTTGDMSPNGKIKLLPSSNSAQSDFSDSFQLRYHLKWWNANYDKRLHHNWVIKVTPKNYRYDLEDEKTQFQGELEIVSDEGDPLNSEVLTYLLDRE